MAKTLVLHNQLGEIVRVFPWTSPKKVWAIFRKDTRRIDILSSLTQVQQEDVPYEVLLESSGDSLASTQTNLDGFGYLKVMDADSVAPNVVQPEEQDDSWRRKTILLGIFAYLLFGLFLTRTYSPTVAEITEEKKKEIVKIVKRQLVIPKKARKTVNMTQTVAKTPKKTVTKKKAWKRKGALAALGQLSKSKQRGGLDLGAMKTSAGPGLGGTQGSGGVQKSIYAKGLVAAPLGEGHNIKGGGGYGTKGKGGGKAGYGTPTLVGSSGASPIPIPSEASVDGGLSADMIAEVVRRNLGQVRFCYEKGLQMEPRLAGRVNVAWVIGSNGGVKTARVKNTSLNNNSVESCIVQRLKTWKFPLPQNRAEVKVSYPFLLKRIGSS